MDISDYLRRVARGKNGAENLTQAESEAVLSALLAADADVLQLGAFLIAERMKGESSAELAGFVAAARRHVAGFGEAVAAQGAVDFPCYAGKRRAAPVHLAAALQARNAGIPVLVHGMQQIEGRVSAWQALQTANIRKASTLREGLRILSGEGMVYMELGDLCPPLSGLATLRPRIGVRTFAHTVARLLNPLCCEGQLNGVFHTPYVALMAQANTLLQQKRSLIFMGAEGEPELYADRQKLMTVQRGHGQVPVAYSDALCDAYPRQVESDAGGLIARFGELCSGRMDAREHAVMQRMSEAFAFASSGVCPQAWVTKMFVESGFVESEDAGEDR